MERLLTERERAPRGLTGDAAHALVIVLAATFAASGVAATVGGPVATPARGAVPWPAPSDPMKRTRAAGLAPEKKEILVHHVHSHLDVFLNGKHVRVPAGVGIDIRSPDVKKFNTPDGTTAYGRIELCASVCISPLHTHDGSGVLHTESSSPTPNRLGQFFTEWAVRLTRTCVGGYCNLASPHIFVDGAAFTGDPRSIPLTDHKEIAIVIGTPPAQIPSKADFSNA